jgi:Fe-Mn family superoxide dismutase
MGTVPLLVGDAWEHAYYLDYRNEKEKWAKAFMALADWHGAETRFHAARDASRVLEGVK